MSELIERIPLRQVFQNLQEADKKKSRYFLSKTGNQVTINPFCTPQDGDYAGNLVLRHSEGTTPIADLYFQEGYDATLAMVSYDFRDESTGIRVKRQSDEEATVKVPFQNILTYRQIPQEFGVNYLDKLLKGDNVHPKYKPQALKLIQILFGQPLKN